MSPERVPGVLLPVAAFLFSLIIILVILRVVYKAKGPRIVTLPTGESAYEYHLIALGIPIGRTPFLWASKRGSISLYTTANGVSFHFFGARSYPYTSIRALTSVSIRRFPSAVLTLTSGKRWWFSFRSREDFERMINVLREHTVPVDPELLNP